MYQIAEKRECLKCKLEKDLNRDNFHFHSTHKCFRRVCKECHNEQVRKKYISVSVEEAKERTEKKREYRKGPGKNKWTLAKYRIIDKNKGLENDLTLEFIELESEKPCTYCGFPSTGLDRLDNSKGHTKVNCVPCCWECNTARMDNFTHEEMKIIGKVIRQVKLAREINLN